MEFKWDSSEDTDALNKVIHLLTTLGLDDGYGGELTTKVKNKYLNTIISEITRITQELGLYDL